MNIFLKYSGKVLVGLIFLTLGFILLACDPIIVDAVTLRERKQFTFAIVDSDYYNLVDRAGKPYHLDSIKIYNQNGQEVDQKWIGKKYQVNTVPELGSAGTGWIYNFNYLQGREVKNLKKFLETFYLYLNAQDTDTILVQGTDRHGFRVYFNGKEETEKSPLNVVHARNYFVK